MRKDKKITDVPANYWAGVTSGPVQDEETRRRMAANARENSPVDEEARRMESRSMREAGPSIMAKMKAAHPEPDMDQAGGKSDGDADNTTKAKKMATKKLASAPMFQKK